MKESAILWGTPLTSALFLEQMAGMVVRAAEDSAHETEMVDPKQNVDFQSSTSVDQMRLALNTLETEFQAPDGVALSQEDAVEALGLLVELRSIIDRIETKLAGYSAEHREKPRSDR